jgi:hypothetical protein
VPYLAVDTSSTAYQLGWYAGLVLLVVLALAVARWAWRRGGAAATIIVVLVAGTLLVLDLKNGPNGSSGGTWATQQGANERTGFIDGCRYSSGGAVDCECAFSRITSTPPYDTPAGFAALKYNVDRFQATHDPGVLPSVFVDAVRGCLN